MKSKKSIVDRFKELKNIADPVANEISAAYQRGAKKVEAMTGRKTKLPDYVKGELDFPPASEVAE